MDFDLMAYFVNINEQIDEIELRNNFQRPTYDTFALTDKLFMKNFRLSKEITRYLINILKPFIVVDTRLSSIDIQTKVLVVLNFFVTGSYQTSVGNSRLMNLSQSSVSRCVKQIVAALNQPEIFNTWVKFPSNIQELDEVRNEFYRKTGFAGVIGCLDCTHIAIVSPSKNMNLVENQYPEYMYVNRKNYHSMNVQLVCDSNLKVLNVNALFPGSTHDVHIWNNSNVSIMLKELHNHNYSDYFLLGDSGYPLRPWLLTPIAQPRTAAEENYNKNQMYVRSVIERCNGVLKMRFRCLLKDRVLHHKPEKATAIINACIVLHNMCIEYNISEVMDETIDEFDLGMYHNQEPLYEHVNDNRNRDLMLGRRQRDRIVGFLHNRNVPQT
ncbi:putative nuclease HARBI1 [Rhopalosiphum padi]|uniref:putative nuclease HARBI1 n=1 Tax=Rhopalosiphum padi TaxID=40932 RepID=UPI00298D7441|nr:putative nuclease HARBI1 [Rhopalosiphum padi]